MCRTRVAHSKKDGLLRPLWNPASPFWTWWFLDRQHTQHRIFSRSQTSNYYKKSGKRKPRLEMICIIASPQPLSCEKYLAWQRCTWTHFLEQDDLPEDRHAGLGKTHYVFWTSPYTNKNQMPNPNKCRFENTQGSLSGFDNQIFHGTSREQKFNLINVRHPINVMWLQSNK